jgi:hypothetical protein
LVVARSVPFRTTLQIWLGYRGSIRDVAGRTLIRCWRQERETDFTFQDRFYRGHKVRRQTVPRNETLYANFLELLEKQGRIMAAVAHDDRVWTVSKYESGGLNPVHLRHLNIENGDIRTKRLGEFNRLAAIGGFRAQLPIRSLRDWFRYETSHRRVVVGN